VNRRRKWLKLTLWIVALLMVVLASLSVMSYIAIRRTPDWYQPDTSTQEQRSRAADRLENMLSLLVNWGQQKHFAKPATTDPQNAGQARSILSQKADEAFPITFTDDELNALFNKWANTHDRREWFEQYVEDPRLVIRGNQLIVVGKAKALDMVVSLVFEPKLTDDGKLDLKLAHVLGGVLPLPDALWSGRKDAIERILREKLPLYQQDAGISPDGVANGDAASAAMNQLLLSMLHYKPTAAVIFVPIVWEAQMSKSLPVKITALSIHDHTIEMTAEPMSADERRALLEELRRPEEIPVNKESAP